jgi:FkbM family methyltransferase
MQAIMTAEIRKDTEAQNGQRRHRGTGVFSFSHGSTVATLVDLRNGLRRLGIDVVRFPPHSDVALRRVQLLNHHGVGTVIDGGAGSGQYGRALRRYGFRGRIISFEPLPQSCAALRAVAASDEAWDVHCQALWDEAGEAPLHQAGNLVSSSLLPMRSRHVDAEPDSAVVSDVNVATVRLDDVADASEGDVFVKLDVQGAERRALAGGKTLLGQASGLQLEVSLVSLYDGDMLIDEAFAVAAGYGMVLQHLEPGFSDPHTGRLLQFDAMFFRT